MDAEKIDIYAACDKAIRAMNRENLRAFGRLKMAKWDEVHVLKTVTAVYRRSAKRARQRYYEIAFEAYLLAMAMCNVDSAEAHRKAEKAMTGEWVDKVLEQTDFVTLYRFNTETERKAARLAEALEEAPSPTIEIDRALKAWTQQVGQYAINVTDYAVAEAFEDASVEMVRWISQKDGRVCHECYSLDEQVFRMDEIPRKPHINCRCRIVPVFRNGDD